MLENFQVALGWEAHQSQRGDGAAAHGVNVTQGVGGGDLAKSVGIVHHGSEEIDGLHQGQVGADPVHTRVIGVIEAHQYVGIVLAWKFAQHLVEKSRTQFGGAASGFYCLGEPDFDFGHRNILEELSNLRIFELLD